MISTSHNLSKELKTHFGFSNFRGEQEDIIKNIFSGKDTFVIMPTGGGKSLCYQLPALMMEGTAIIVSPLIALMKNQVDQIRGYNEKEGIAHYLNSTLSRSGAKKVREDLVNGITKLLYIAPETLTKESHIDFFKSLNISFVAVDEAHCISEWGHDFRPEYRNIRKTIDNINPDIPLVALTATATPKVQVDIKKNLHLRNPTVFLSSFNRPNLFYEIKAKKDKDWVIKDMITFIKQHNGKSGIIYCLSRKFTEEIANLLKANGIKALPYHAGLDAGVRSSTQDKFLNEDVDVIVATIAFGMGIDKPDVRFVIHYNIPKSLENYYQETGRAGRDGMEGHCIAYYSYSDIIKLEKFMKDKPIAEKEVNAQLLSDIVGYVETASCRRQFVLQYFGEKYQEQQCSKMCDNCRNPREKTDEREAAVVALKAVKEIKEKFDIPHVVNFLMGQITRDIKEYEHFNLPSFGKGKDKSKNFWNSIIRQSILHNLLGKDIEHQGALYLTERGKKFLVKPEAFEIALNINYDQIESEYIRPTNGSTSADPVLLSMLKDLRKVVAKEIGLPPFVIFQDPSLEEFAIHYPTNLDDLKNITGVSKGKALKYGSKFVKLIEQYVEENEIERPDDLIIKSVVNKSGLKVFIIQCIDKKIPLEEIARLKGIAVDEILEELEIIVNSGTKININYYIDDVVDEEKQDIIFDYFSTADSDDLDEAYDELIDEDVTYEDLQLMRIKFMSEVAN